MFVDKEPLLSLNPEKAQQHYRFVTDAAAEAGKQELLLRVRGGNLQSDIAKSSYIS